eukprot:126925_1
MNTIKAEIIKELLALGESEEEINKGLNNVNLRLSWNINSLCLIYSRKNKHWFAGKIIDIFIHQKTNKEWLMIAYNAKNIKQIQRFSEFVKPYSKYQCKHKIIQFICAKLKESNITHNVTPNEQRKMLSETIEEKTYTTQLENDEKSLSYQSVYSQNQCFDSQIIKCKSSKIIIQILNSHITEKTQCSLDNITIENAFNHLLFDHNNDPDFEYMFASLSDCNVKNCMSIQRNQRRRKQSNQSQKKSLNISLFSDLMDKIHCHFHHSYDFGYRIQNTIQQKIKQLSHNAKRFYSVVKQKLTSEEKKDEGSVIYSYSFRFYYWKYYQNQQRVDSMMDDGIQIKNLYIQPKYGSFKDELINNQIATIASYSWDFEMAKAIQKTKLDYCRRLYAKINGQSNYEKKRLQYNFVHGTPITAKHLMSIIIYCGYDVLQFKFSGSMRKLNKTETIGDVKKRHGNFYYLARYLRETVEIFGRRRVIGCQVFYHGITTQMLFNSTFATIKGPFSTTPSLAVACQFSHYKGLIMEILPAPELKYFDCSWLSPYSSELEMLFIGGLHAIKFVNITNAGNGEAYLLYIKALSIIDCMTTGQLFEDDGSILVKYMYSENYKSNKSTNPIDYGGKRLSNSLKQLVFQIINTECHHKYKFPSYIEALIHHIFQNKLTVRLHVHYFNVEIDRIISANGGYIGYLFAKHWFFGNFTRINVKLITKLFPNCTALDLRGAQLIAHLGITDILHYLADNKVTSLEKIDLIIDKPNDETDNMLKDMINIYGLQFQNNGFIASSYRIDGKWPTIRILKKQIFQNWLKDFTLISTKCQKHLQKGTSFFYNGFSHVHVD